MSETVECVVWCAKCAVDKFTVYRVPVGEGVYTNECEPKDAVKTRCQCGETLTRKL